MKSKTPLYSMLEECYYATLYNHYYHLMSVLFCH